MTRRGVSVDRREEIEKITWQRETSAFGGRLVKGLTRVLISNDSGRNALDLACGDGLLTKEICRYFSHVVGVDASSRHIEVARKRVPKAEFYVSLIEDFNPGEELFDRIYMLNILEHLDDPVSTLAQVTPWLAKNGIIVICVPNALSLNRRIGKEMRIIQDCYELSCQDIKVGHKRFYDMTSLRRHVIDSGLNVVSSGGIFLKPFANLQMDYFVNHCLTTDELREKFCDACLGIASELPEYSSPIWVKCE